MIELLVRSGLGLRWCDNRGVSAVEFALIFPVLILLYVGGTELTHILTVDRKLTKATATVGDLVARSNGQADARIGDILNSAGAILAPYRAEGLTIIVSAVAVGDGGGTVKWSEARNGTRHPPGAALDVPAGFESDADLVIVAESEFKYRPFIASLLLDEITLSARFHMIPRSPGPAAEDAPPISPQPGVSVL